MIFLTGLLLGLSWFTSLYFLNPFSLCCLDSKYSSFMIEFSVILLSIPEWLAVLEAYMKISSGFSWSYFSITVPSYLSKCLIANAFSLLLKYSLISFLNSPIKWENCYACCKRFKLEPFLSWKRAILRIGATGSLISLWITAIWWVFTRCFLT